MAYRSIIFAYIYYHLAVGSCAQTNTEKNEERNSLLTEQKPFSIDDVVFYGHGANAFNGTWIYNNKIFYRQDEHFDIFDLTTQTSRRLAYDPVFLDKDVFPSSDGTRVLLRSYVKNVNSYVPVNKYSVCEIDQYGCVDVRELVKDKLLQAVLWAPKGNALVYVLDNDIYYRDFDGNPEQERRITTTGRMEEIFNGVADWLYAKEVFQLVFELEPKLMWFSPNASHLAFITLNDTYVDDMVISRYNTPGSIDDQYPEVVKYKYPKAGTLIPEVSLNLIDLTSNVSSLINLLPPDDIESESILFAVDWLDDETIVATWTNREQNYLQIVTYSLTGQQSILITLKAPVEGWLLDNIIRQAPKMAENYLVLIELQSIDDPNLGSFPHVIRYHMVNGTLTERVDLTPAATWVHKIIAIDKSRHLVYYVATPPGEPSQKQLYTVDLKVTLKPKCISCEIKTREGNACKFVNQWSAITFSKDFSHSTLACTGPDPTSIIIYNTQQPDQTYEWFGNDKIRQMLNERIQPKHLKLEIPANGFDAKVHIILPAYFNETIKYPMIVYVYGGPNNQFVTDEFRIGFEHYTTTRRQVIHAVIDGRGTNSKGTAMLYAVYHKLGDVEMQDQITVTRKLLEMYSWIDSDRIGIWGRSYGGYSTAAILSKDERNLFKCGIVVSPVTSWLYYEATYAERYMGLPTLADNLKGYESSQVTDKAEKFLNKTFMLVHGSGDDNVHLQQSMALSKALVDAGVLFEQFIYPDENHSLDNVDKHLYRSFDKFFSQCFGYDFD